MAYNAVRDKRSYLPQIVPISHGILNYTYQQTARHERKTNIN
jgi:hypothetical protein